MSRIDILMATYNGEEFIEQQLISVLNQSFNNTRLIIRDDGSTDRTKEIITRYAKIYYDRIKVIDDNDNNLGASQNFSKLFEFSTANYIMFCDQDDIWLSIKIEKSLKRMVELESVFGKSKPILVHTGLIVANRELNILSKPFYQHPIPTEIRLNKLLALNNNNITGCTVMINKSLKKLASPIPSEAVMHDQWLSLVGSAFGVIDYLPESTMVHILHGKNTIGKLYSLPKLIRAILNENIYNKACKKVLMKIQQSKQLLKRYDELFCQKKFSKQKEIIQHFVRLEEVIWLKRLMILIKYNIIPYGFIKTIWQFLVVLGIKYNK